MTNIIFGVIAICICTIFCFFAWSQSSRGNYKLSLMLILICGLTMRIFMASDHYLHEWDERYHALVAKNLIQHPLKPTLYDNTIIKYDYQAWTANNVWLEKPPVPLWFIALSINLFGNTDYAVRIPTIIFSLLAIYLTFLLWKYPVSYTHL